MAWVEKSLFSLKNKTPKALQLGVFFPFKNGLIGGHFLSFRKVVRDHI